MSNPGKFPEFPLQQPEGRRQSGMVIKERAVSSLTSCSVCFLFVCLFVFCLFVFFMEDTFNVQFLKIGV